jgi:hypothetical protein
MPRSDFTKSAVLLDTNRGGGIFLGGGGSGSAGDRSVPAFPFPVSDLVDTLAMFRGWFGGVLREFAFRSSAIQDMNRVTI